MQIRKRASRPKVTLVVPNFKWAKWDPNTLWHYIPYNLCLLASMVRDICDVNILDAYAQDMTPEEFRIALKRLDPDIVGITVLMDQYAQAGHSAAKMAKLVGKDILVVFGGVHATVHPEETVKDPNIDIVVIGEGEHVFRDLVHYFLGKRPLPDKGICYKSNGKVINTGHSDFIQDLDALPLPSYDMIDFKKYANSATRKSVDSPRKFPYARIFTSRGCPFSCIYCQVRHIMGKRFRARNADNVLNEIEYLKNKYRIKSIIFDDDNLFTDQIRAKDIFKGMIDRRLNILWSSISTSIFKLDEEIIKLMKASGCVYVGVAIESGTERIRDMIKKPVNLKKVKELICLLKKEGIYVAANFMIGFPSETWDEIRKTIKFAEDLNADYIKLFVVIPLRHTELWSLCEKKKAFKKGFNEVDMRWSEGQLETDEFTADNLTILRAYEWDRINFSNPEKRKKTFAMMGITEKELKKIRKTTLDNASRG